ncbi:hypothetical protein M3Y94_00536400 [Aphelenchoides besseyi]|nr:hypothetical protein M3Y94_00536400 [Aphelenchoides besseyi]
MTGSTFSMKLNDSSTRLSTESPTKMDDEDESNVMLQLHHELQRLYLILFPTPAEWCMRVTSFLRLRHIIIGMDPRLKIEIYGSTSQQLYLPSSDLDVAVENPFGGIPDLDALGKMLRDYGFYESVQVIGKSAYPILKLVETGTNLNIDIGFNVRHSMAAVTWVRQVRTTFPFLEPLVIIIKHFLHHKSLNVPYNGGLTSYALIVMVAHFLKRFDLNQLDESIRRAPLGMLLLKFMEFYGETFDIMKYALVFTDNLNADFVEKDQLPVDNFHCPSMLTIMDPVSPGNNIGSGAHNIVYIRTSFCIAASALRVFLNCDMRHTSIQQVLHSIIPVTRADQLSRRRTMQNIQTAFPSFPPIFVPPYSPFVDPSMFPTLIPVEKTH